MDPVHALQTTDTLRDELLTAWAAERIGGSDLVVGWFAIKQYELQTFHS